jgi:hypothetical protein
MNRKNFLGRRVELVVHLKDQFRRLRRGEQGTITGHFGDGFNVPLQVAWDNGARWSVHYEEIRLLEDRAASEAASAS